MSIYKRSKTSLIIFRNYIFNKFFSVSTINSIVGVLCSVIASKRLKMRKSLAISYRQDTISGIKVNNNVININKLWGVSTTQLIFPCLKSTREALKKRCKICSKVIITWTCFTSFSIVDFEQVNVSGVVLEFCAIFHCNTIFFQFVKYRI